MELKKDLNLLQRAKKELVLDTLAITTLAFTTLGINHITDAKERALQTANNYYPDITQDELLKAEFFLDDFVRSKPIKYVDQSGEEAYMYEPKTEEEMQMADYSRWIRKQYFEKERFYSKYLDWETANTVGLASVLTAGMAFAVTRAHRLFMLIDYLSGNILKRKGGEK